MYYDKLPLQIVKVETFQIKFNKSLLYKIKFREKENQEQNNKKGNQARKWDLTGTNKDAPLLDYSAEPTTDSNTEEGGNGTETTKIYDQNVRILF